MSSCGQGGGRLATFVADKEALASSLSPIRESGIRESGIRESGDLGAASSLPRLCSALPRLCLASDSSIAVMVLAASLIWVFWYFAKPRHLMYRFPADLYRAMKPLPAK